MRYLLFILLFTVLCSEAKAQGDFVLVFLHFDDNKLKERENPDELNSRHKEWITRLKEKKIITFQGYFEDGDQLLIFPQSDLHKVKSIVAGNPLTEAQLLRPEYFHTDIRHGSFCTSSAEKMKKFNFIRYTSHITKYNVQMVPQLLKMHDDYLKLINATGNVAAEGVFSNSDGGFIIIRGNLGQEVILNDPTYQAGFTIPEIQDIFIAEDSFCK